ncbi:hypothetical protein ASG19_06770 [Rhizobium sp. Leaf306]|uniref:ATP-binding protein n=1 Tax=Rhizobium sp. Leaf306 TaxID=1736330 RepID=UPI000713EBE3|nr:ATP-binding protein [Rhizobium sp. Leaf306]KQQ38716.1 hypothetical protein ASG19_06770 [Rhizobium sp. Leaf306]
MDTTSIENAREDDTNRPSEMEMTFMSGIVRTLGADMYSNLGKVLVEFIANAHDSDASRVNIKIDFEAIAAERIKLRTQHQAASGKAFLSEADGGTPTPDEVSSTLIENFDAIQQILPPNFQIVIEDNGHGMSWQDVKNKFLSVNHQRRKDSSGLESILRTPGGRMVMGRKGVGKLAGFGAALRAEVETTIEGEPFATIVTIDTESMQEGKPIEQLKLPVTYKDVDAGKKGTTITLSRLRAEALKERQETVIGTIQRRFFGLKPEDFEIRINDVPIPPYHPDYVFIYPPEITVDKIKKNELATAYFEVPEVGKFPFKYYVGFRPKSLKGNERGARIYCNKRAAAGPSLFGMATGMHNFYGSDYMECMVEADVLDRGGLDLIATDRGDLKEGNEIVESFLEVVRGLMIAAVRAHGKWREEKAEDDIKADPIASMIERQIMALPAKTREPSRKLLRIFARDYDVGSEEFQDLAPTLIRSINSSEVLIQLSSSGIHLKTIEDLTVQLRQVSDIERWDALKLYKARKNGILKLMELHERSISAWKKEQNEREFHQLLKENPWLIRPEFSHYISSDERMEKVVSKVARELRVDKFAKVVDGNKVDVTRPDLVFLASEPSIDGPFIIKIVELKAPTIGLRLSHWRQLEDYIYKTVDWCEANLSHKVNVQGILIGELPKPNPSIQDEAHLLAKYFASTPRDPIRIIGMSELIKDARTAHIDAIDVLERELDEEGVETFDEPIKASTT